jgi:vacuolar-type H+-ATPase subunit I/STV1
MAGGRQTTLVDSSARGVGTLTLFQACFASTKTPLGFRFRLSDFMTEPNSASPTAAETADILRFLHRFADLMSNGSNSDNLLRAAKMLEAHIALLRETQDMLQVERIRGDASVEARQALEARIGEFEQEILALKSGLAEQHSRNEIIVAEMERRLAEFLHRAEEAEALLAAAVEAPPAMPFGCIAVPLAALRIAKTQFEALAAAFEKSGNIVSQAMCEASASSLERVILDAGVADDADDRSQNAA